MDNPEKLAEAEDLLRQTVQGDDSFRPCPTCGLKLSWSTRTCPNDGTVAGGEPKTGSIFKGHYEFLEVLGEGGMSVVYKAHDKVLGRMVAIKLLHPHVAGSSKQMILRFQQEAKAASLLSHPNVISVYEFGTSDDGQAYLIMDYADGRSLAQIVSSQGRLPLTRALGIFIQVADALSHAHRKNVIHRDLKPSNIMLCRDDDGEDVAKVVDFGIAKIVQPDADQRGLTQTGEVFGSPPYMSPEQCGGWAMNNRSDIYSMGCMMFEALTGAPPFVGGSLVETVYQHMNDPAPRLVAGNEKFPEVLENIIARTLEKDPVNRYESMEHLRDDLTRVLAEVEGHETDGNYWCEKDSRAKRKWHPLVVPTVVVILVAGVLATLTTLTMPYSNTVAEKDIMKAMPRESLLPNYMPDWTGGDKEVQKSFGNDPNMTMLYLDGKPVSDRGFKGAGKLKWLHTISVDDTEVSDAILQELKDLPALQELRMNRTMVSNDGMELISRLPLSHLEVADSKVNARGLPAIAKIKSLKVLNLSKMSLTDADLAPLAMLPNLQELNLDGNHISGKGLAALKDLGLRKLVLSNNPFTDDSMSQITRMQQLTDLDLSNTGITDSAGQKLGELPKLRSVQLQHTNVSNRTVQALAKLPAMVELNLAQTKITARCLPMLSGMTRLVSLDLGGSFIDDHGLAKLQSLKHLEKLGLSDTLISDKSLDMIVSHFRAMKQLNLSGTEITNTGVALLADLPLLNYLQTANCRRVDFAGLGKVHLAHPRIKLDRDEIF